MFLSTDQDEQTRGAGGRTFSHNFLHLSWLNSQRENEQCQSCGAGVNQGAVSYSSHVPRLLPPRRTQHLTPAEDAIGSSQRRDRAICSGLWLCDMQEENAKLSESPKDGVCLEPSAVP